MYRIYIDWTFVSPSLKTIKGIVSVHRVLNVSEWILLTKFTVVCKPGSTGYKSCSEGGIPTKVFNAIKPELDALVRGYHEGLTLDPDSYHWVSPEDNEKALDAQKELLKEVKEDDVIYKACSEYLDI
jgi:hypothetical protein